MGKGDDGSKSGSGFKIATCGFELEDIKILSFFLKDKFNLICSIHKDRKLYNLYIHKKSALNFVSLISPYLLPSMEYKLGSFSKHSKK